jgi:hypothetical protein
MADPDLDPYPDAYVGLMALRCTPAGLAWLRERTAERMDATALGAAFAGATRRLGTAPIALTAEERSTLAAAGLPEPQDWPLDQLGRAVLLRTALAAAEPDGHGECVRTLYQRGDNRERIALLRSLALLPAPERFLAIAIEACRTHIEPIFEAIACENPYPARCFPDSAFNQLVLKALFIGVPLARIADLHARVTAELARMARDYAAERSAAGRDVPSDIGLLIQGAQRAEPGARATP